MDRFLRDGKHIKGVWSDFMKKSKLNQKLQEHEITSRWEELAGSLVARHTSNISLYKNILTIQLDSAPLKAEVNSRKTSLMAKINSGLDSAFVEEIIIR